MSEKLNLFKKLFSKFACLLLVSILILHLFTGCSNKTQDDTTIIQDNTNSSNGEVEDPIKINQNVSLLEDGLRTVRFDGNYYFNEFLSSGGASKDEEVVNFLSHKLSMRFRFLGNPFGCSTVAVPGKNGYIFGRNFDWYTCDALIVESHSEGEYASISTVNTNFISGIDFSSLSDKEKAIIALYAPLDGMNEKGLAVSVNMLSDGRDINQVTDKTDITTTTAIRLLLNRAANVNEAVGLLKNYDLHASMGYMVHFAIADNEGNSVVVEYIDNKISTVSTKVVTNYYLSDNAPSCPDYTQAHIRYNTLQDKINKLSTFTPNDVKNMLNSVSRHNYGGSETTEWSIVFELDSRRVTYYHRENFERGFTFIL